MNPDNKKKGIMYILLSAFFFSVMTVLVRLSGDLPTMQKVFFRNLVAALFAWTILLKDKEKIHIKKSDLPDFLLRSIAGVIGVVLNFYAIDHLNISDANLLNKLSPFFSMLMSIFILKEKPTKKEWALIAVAFVGALFVIKPGFNMDIVPAIGGALSGLGAGTAYTFVRKLGKKGVNSALIVMFFSTFTMIVSLPFFIIGYKPMSISQFLCLLGAGIFAGGGQVAITAAYTHAPAKEISVYDYTQVIFTAIIGLFLFGQVPDIFSIIGYIIIICAAVFRGKIK